MGEKNNQDEEGSGERILESNDDERGVKLMKKIRNKRY